MPPLPPAGIRAADGRMPTHSDSWLFAPKLLSAVVDNFIVFVRCTISRRKKID
jgi:hypothetical protein